MYDILKDYEPLVVGSILRTDPLVESHQLWTETLKSILEVCPLFQGTYLFTRLQPHNVNFDRDYKHHLLGALGWLKCFGHPHIKPELGLEQMLKNIEKNKIEVIDEAVNISYQFKKMFITGYYLKHHTWPKVEDPLLLPDSIYSHYVTNTWPSSFQYRNIKLSDWGLYPLVNILKYNTDFSTVEILSDKALAVPANDWVQSFDQCTFSCQNL